MCWWTEPKQQELCQCPNTYGQHCTCIQPNLLLSVTTFLILQKCVGPLSLFSCQRRVCLCRWASRRQWSHEVSHSPPSAGHVSVLTATGSGEDSACAGGARARSGASRTPEQRRRLRRTPKPKGTGWPEVWAWLGKPGRTCPQSQGPTEGSGSRWPGTASWSGSRWSVWARPIARRPAELDLDPVDSGFQGPDCSSSPIRSDSVRQTQATPTPTTGSGGQPSHPGWGVRGPSPTEGAPWLTIGPSQYSCCCGTWSHRP